METQNDTGYENWLEQKKQERQRRRERQETDGDRQTDQVRLPSIASIENRAAMEQRAQRTAEREAAIGRTGLLLSNIDELLGATG